MPMVIAFQRAQGGDVLTRINEWEAVINVLEREIIDMSKIGLFLGMVPTQQSGHVNDKVASIDARARLKGSNSVRLE